MVLALTVLPGSTIRVHASSAGLVCLADVSSAPSSPANPCFAAPGPVFGGPSTSPNQQIRIGVYVNGSGGFLAFDITMKANSSVLKPAGVDLSGSVLVGQPTILLECLGTFNVTGGSCPAPVDTADTLRLAVAVIFQLTPTPTTGLLFTAIYNITGTTSSAMSLDFQSGCDLTSVVGTSICVAFADGTRSPVPENVQGATFDNTIFPPFLTVQSKSGIVGPMTVGSVESLRLNLTGQNGWNSSICFCLVSLSTVESSSSIGVLLNNTNIDVPSGLAFVGMNVTGTAIGNFSVTVFAEYSTLDLQTLAADTLVAHLSLEVIVTDFSMSSNPVIIPPVLAGVATSFLVTVTGENGFTGLVALTIVSGSQCSLSTNTVMVVGSASSILYCSSILAGNYTAIVAGRSGPDFHTLQVGFTVQDFAVSASSSVVSFVAGSSGSITLSVKGVNGFDQVVSVQIVSRSGLTITPTKSTFLAPGTVGLSFAGDSAGVYNVTVMIAAGTVSHSVMVEVKVTAAPSRSSTLFGMDPTLFYSLLVVLGVVVAGVATLGVRRRRKTRLSRPSSYEVV